MFLVTLIVAPLSSKQSAFGFLLGTIVISNFPLALLATALQLDVFRPQMQTVNLQVLLGPLV
jgi:hypothetical protein